MSSRFINLGMWDHMIGIKGDARDALDQLRYEDVTLRRLHAAFEDENRDRLQHGKIVKLIVERLAVREAALEYVEGGLANVPGASELSAGMKALITQNRADLDRLDELTRGITPININQGQDVDSVVREIAPRLLAEIEQDLADRIPAVERLVDRRRRGELLPSASYLLRHCPLHPGPHPGRWYDRIGPLVWLHAVYDYLQSLPVGGVKPRAEVCIPGEGVVALESVGRSDSPTRQRSPADQGAIDGP